MFDDSANFSSSLEINENRKNTEKRLPLRKNLTMSINILSVINFKAIRGLQLKYVLFLSKYDNTKTLNGLIKHFKLRIMESLSKHSNTTNSF